MKRYSITNKNVVYLFQDIIWYSAIFIFIIVLLYYNLGDDMELFMLVLLLFILYFLCFNFLPVIYLYEQYSFYNKGKELILYEDKIDYNGEIILLSDIEKVKIIGTYQYFNGKKGEITSLPYNPYFYYVEISANDKRYILTSLLGFSLAEDLKEIYTNLDYENVIKWYPKIEKKHF